MTLPPRPHPCTRSARVDRVNGWLKSAWSKGLCSRPSLEPGTLWAKAAASLPASGEIGGRSEDDVADFRLRLDILTRSLANEAQLNALGLTMAHGQLVRNIRQRLALGALWQRKPEMLETPIAPPLIVVGQMRSGTTRVHRLLAADPALSSTRFCDSWNPLPRSPDTRPVWSAISLLFARAINPWLDAIHPFGVTRADEELGWLALALDHCAYEAQWRIPEFVAFSENREAGPVYREFARILRTDACWHGNGDRPRVLKVPQFAEDLPSLLAQFPDARVIVTRRNSDEISASAVSLVANQMAIQSDTASLEWIEAEVQRKIALRDARMNAALSSFDGPVSEVHFSDLDICWESEMRRVYSELDMDLSVQAVAAMRAEQGRARHGVHQQHSSSYGGFTSAGSAA